MDPDLRLLPKTSSHWSPPTLRSTTPSPACRGSLSWQPPTSPSPPFAAPIPGSAVGVRQDNHHANRRTPKLILLDEIFSTLLRGKPASGVTDYEQQQALGGAAVRGWRLRDFPEGLWGEMALQMKLCLTHQIERGERNGTQDAELRCSEITCVFPTQVEG